MELAKSIELLYRNLKDPNISIQKYGGKKRMINENLRMTDVVMAIKLTNRDKA